MRFSTISTFIFASVAALVSAQSEQNAFTAPVAGTTLTAGQPFTLKWNNIVGDTVTISLRNGNVNDLNTQTVIAQNIANTGSYTWNVPSTIVYGSDDTFAIQWGAGGVNQINFSARFILNSQYTSVGSTTVSATTTSASSSSSSGMTTSTVSSASTATTTSSGASTTSTGTSTTSSGMTTSTGKTSSTTSSKSSSTGSSTSATASPTTSPVAPNSGNSNLASPLAIILCIMAAVMYTN